MFFVRGLFCIGAEKYEFGVAFCEAVYGAIWMLLDAMVWAMGGGEYL